MPYSKEQLTPHAKRLFENLKTKLPPEIAARLRSQTKFTTHGTRKSVYNFDIWDSSQNGVLPRNYFKYCLAYDYEKLNDGEHDGYFHLWLSTVRIYRQHSEIKQFLEREIPDIAPRGFKLEFCEDRAISCGKVFNWPTELEGLEDIILKDYVRLIGAIHPLLIPIIDRFSASSFDSNDRKAEVKQRGRVPIARKGGPLNREKLRIYTRSIPPSWRSQLLDKANHKCHHCGAELSARKVHIDHIVPFSKGGDTVLSNLQALCGPCNLAKGNRDDSTERGKKRNRIPKKPEGRRMSDLAQTTEHPASDQLETPPRAPNQAEDVANAKPNSTPNAAVSPVGPKRTKKTSTKSKTWWQSLRALFG
jgi:hypothetical protein